MFDLGEVRQQFGASATYLGTGSFGETFRVDDLAVKVIHTDTGVRLEREVAGLNRVTSDNVVRLVRVDSVVLAGADRPALWFEYIDGPNVAEKLDAGKFLPPEQFDSFALGLLRGLSALHAEGVIHRDIKPANVALRSGLWSRPVVLDLGLVKLLDLRSITNYPALVGTAMYMAPEQLAGTRVRRVADIFSCGALLYEAVSGLHPFVPPDAAGLTQNDLIAAIDAGVDPAPLDNLDAEACSMVTQMLSYAEHRRGTTRSLIRQLEKRIGI